MTASEIVNQAYALAKKSEHRELRELIAEDATWEPNAKKKKRKWKPAEGADEIVRMLLWRAGPANKLRPDETIEVGPHVVFRLRGKRLELIGGRGFWAPKLYQSVEVKGGKIVRMRDYGTLEEALAGAGHDS